MCRVDWGRERIPVGEREQVQVGPGQLETERRTESFYRIIYQELNIKYVKSCKVEHSKAVYKYL